jgi:hypothetical protein
MVGMCGVFFAGSQLNAGAYELAKQNKNTTQLFKFAIHIQFAQF